MKNSEKNEQKCKKYIYDWKKLIYPVLQIYIEKIMIIKKYKHKREYFSKICAKYELDKDNKLIYIGNNPKKN